MAVVTKRNKSEMPKYQYKLNENHKGADFASINGVNLSRNWKTFFEYKHVLEKELRNYNNKEGRVDFQVLDPINSDIFEKNPSYDTERPVYTRKELTTFDRTRIEELSLLWHISPVKKRTEFLIDLIMKEQQLYEEFQENKEKEPIVENIKSIEEYSKFVKDDDFLKNKIGSGIVNDVDGDIVEKENKDKDKINYYPEI